MSAAIKTIIFDLSEVLIAGLCGVEEALAPRVGSPPVEVLAVLGGDLLAQLCRGEISEDAFLQSAIASRGWNISVAELKQSVRTNFSRKVAGMENLLERLAAQYELVLLSDHAKEWIEHIHEIHPHLKIFRARIYSFELGQTKREPSTFQRLLERIHRRGDECVFIDDNPGNVERARCAGIQAFHFTDAKTLWKDLQSAALLPPIVFREMERRDINRCLQVRTSVRENHYSLAALAKEGITEESASAMLATTHKGWVCETEQRVVGFSMSNRSTGEFWVVAVLPEYEGRGIGRKLMELAIDWLWSNGCEEIWLWTSPDTTTRAYALYRKSGWEDCGVQKNQRIMKLKSPPSACMPAR